MWRGGLILGFALLLSCSSGAANTPLNSAGASAVGGAASTGQGGASGASQSGSGGVGVAGGAGGAGVGAAGNGGGSEAGGTSGAASCNTIANSAPVIQELAVAGSAPAPVGGTITDGTYYETSYLVYTGFGTPKQSTVSHKLTATIAGATFQTVFVDETATEQRLTLQLTPSGTMLGEQQTCRTNTDPKFMMNQLFVLGYDATPTTLTFHLLQDELTGDYTVYTLTKQ